MRYIEQGTEFEARLVAVPGLTGLTVQVTDPDAADAVLVPAVDVLEDGAHPGRYVADIVAPDAALDGHAYALVWTIPAAPTVLEDLIVTTDAPAVNIAALPDVDEVAAFLRARTRNKHGVEAGTFTADTRPTRGQALAIIGVAQGRVAGAVGFGILPDGLARRARGAVALMAAMLIELSYFPEQVTSGRSPYVHLKELYDDEFARLERVAGDDDTDGDGVPDTSRWPSWRVPNHCMTTFDTEF